MKKRTWKSWWSARSGVFIFTWSSFPYFTQSTYWKLNGCRFRRNFDFGKDYSCYFYLIFFIYSSYHWQAWVPDKTSTFLFLVLVWHTRLYQWRICTAQYQNYHFHQRPKIDHLLLRRCVHGALHWVSQVSSNKILDCSVDICHSFLTFHYGLQKTGT